MGTTLKEEKQSSNLSFELNFKLPLSTELSEPQLDSLGVQVRQAVLSRLSKFSRLLSMVIDKQDLVYWQELDAGLIQLAFSLEVRGLDGATDIIRDQACGVEDITI